jgi:DNA-binding transcriptional ArsR family regulator
MPVEESVVLPGAGSVSVALEPVHNALNSLLLVTKATKLSGLGEWVTDTATALTPEEHRRHALVILGLFPAVVPDRGWSSFPAYLDYLATRVPEELRDGMLASYARRPILPESSGGEEDAGQGSVDLEAVLQSAEAYLSFLRARYPAQVLNEEIEAQAYSYAVDPPAMQELIVSHLDRMWKEHLAPEWRRVEPMLEDAVSAYQQVGLTGVDRMEAARLVTGREPGEEWEQILQQPQQVVFAPSAHMGPYLGKLGAGGTLWVFFGARLPEGVSIHAPDLSRAEILVRLNALADDTRLRILRLIVEEGEQRSSDIMVRLDLSQSAASRHLMQLSAAGYLCERRCEGAKCYALNTRRIEQTLRAVSTFLLQK